MRAATLFALAAGLAFPPIGVRAEDAQGAPKVWTFTGRTEAAAAADLRARATGDLTRLAVQEGEVVKKGQLLAEVDPRPYRLDLDGARARLKVAEARLQAAKLKAAGVRKLGQDKVVSKAEVALSAAAEAEAEGALLAARVGLERAALALSWTRVMAPFDGRVGHIRCVVGDLVTADRTRILRLVASGPLRVAFDVPETTLLQLRRDGLAEPGKLDVAIGSALDEGYPHAAKLDLIGGEVDPKAGTMRLRATLPNPKGLLSPGMFARVRLTPRPK